TAMPTPRSPRLRFALAPAVLLAALALTIGAQPPDSKKPADTKAAAKDLPVVKLPDGTFLWLGGDERVTLSPQEFQKLLDQVEQLKKQLAAKKATPPGGCAVRGHVEKRGEQLVAVLKLTCTFRTALPQ